MSGTSSESAGVLLAVSAGLALATVNSTIVNVALPAIGRHLHADLVLLQWVVNSFTLVYCALLLPAGPVGDRIGRRRLLLGGMSVFAAGSVACAVAPDITSLIGGRVLQGIGGSAIVPGGLALLARQFGEPAARARALGVWAGVASLGLAVGPVVGGVLISGFGWRSVFWLLSGLAAASVVMVRRLVPERLHGADPQAAPFDWPGALLGGIWLAALSFALIEAHEYGWSSPEVLGSFKVTAASLAGFVRAEQRRPPQRPPLMPLGVWRSRSFIAANLGGLAYFLSLFGILFFFSLYLQQQRGDSALAAGLLFLPLTVVMAVLGPVAGRLVARIGVRPVVTVGFAVAGCGCLALAALPGGSGHVDLELRLLLTGVGFGLMSTPMTTPAVWPRRCTTRRAKRAPSWEWRCSERCSPPARRRSAGTTPAGRRRSCPACTQRCSWPG